MSLPRWTLRSISTSTLIRVDALADALGSIAALFAAAAAPLGLAHSFLLFKENHPSWYSSDRDYER